jgi:hypothetical protein
MTGDETSVYNLGCQVGLTLAISARRPEGFDESTVRTISENSRTLKFEGYGFEEGQMEWNNKGEDCEYTTECTLSLWQRAQI